VAGPAVRRLTNYLRSIVRKPNIASGVTVNDQLVAGWVRDRSRPDLRLTVSIVLAGQVVGTTEALLPRPALVAAGIDDGRFGFNFGRVLSPAEVNAVGVIVEGAQLPIHSRRSLQAVASDAGAARGPYRSRFGGLWTDRVDAKDVLARRHQEGAVHRR
jgi:hypothetical protein